MLELDNLHKTLGNRTLLQGISLPYAAQKLAPPIIEEKEETTP